MGTIAVICGIVGAAGVIVLLLAVLCLWWIAAHDKGDENDVFCEDEWLDGIGYWGSGENEGKAKG